MENFMEVRRRVVTPPLIRYLDDKPQTYQIGL